jgi:hypothetical protein
MDKEEYDEDSEDLDNDSPEDEHDRGDYLVSEDAEDTYDEDEGEDGEEEADDEADGTEDDEDGPAEQEEDEEEGPGIPRSRLNQVIQQRESEKERVRWLEKQLEILIKSKSSGEAPPTPAESLYDFDQAETSYIEKILEGDIESAQKIRSEINIQRNSEYQRQIEVVKESIKEASTQETVKALDEVKFKDTLADITAKYPSFDDKSKRYNEKAVRLANSLMASYVKEGESKTKALLKAIKDVAPLFENSASKAEQRNADARERAVRASKAQPPESQAKGGKATRNLENVDVSKLPDKVFRSLSRKELSKLRGDIL